MTRSDAQTNLAHDAEQQRARILSYEAGPELDALIAEKIFSLMPCDGWVPMNFGSAGGPALAKRCDHAPETCYSTRTIGSIHGRIGGAPPYSTDPGAAWLVVEHLRQQGWLIRVQEMPDGFPYLDNDSGRPAFYAKSLVTLDWMPDRTTADLRKKIRTHIMERGLTPAEAICRAALSAVAADELGYDYPLFGPGSR